MADADFDGLDGGDRSGMPTGARAQRLAQLSGAVASLALIVGAVIWGYQLAVRDIRGVPVIQAMDGPMRMMPTDPGGEIADHQGLSVNAVAAVGVVAPPPERLVLAPRPVELAPEDAAGLAGLPMLDTAPATMPAPGGTGAADLALAAAPPVESASPTAIAVDAALAEALQEILSEAEPFSEGEPLPDVIADSAAEGALTRSPRPRVRPASRPAPPAAAAPEVVIREVDPATIPPGTRLVQFGAFDTQDAARAEWARLSGPFGELMGDKGLVLQPAESGGRTFFRLRAHGFEDEDDARRFCSAFVSQGATCIPVPQR